MSFIFNYKVTSRLFLMYCSASLFLNKRTLYSFGMYTSVYKHVHQIIRNFGYRFLISKIQICPVPERIQKVWIVYSHIVRRDTSCLRQYDYLCYIRLICFAPIFHDKVTNKNWIFRNPKGTLYSHHCIFKLRAEADWQQETWRAQLEF
jgi:hypothetical protein